MRETLESVLEKEKSGDVNGAVLAMYWLVDPALFEGRFEDVNSWLERLDVDSLHPRVPLGFLMATFTAPRERLPARKALLEGTHRRLKELYGTPSVDETIGRLR